jgi:hypothetical protein
MFTAQNNLVDRRCDTDQISDRKSFDRLEVPVGGKIEDSGPFCDGGSGVDTEVTESIERGPS